MDDSRCGQGPTGLGFAVWGGDAARVRKLLSEGAAVDEYGDGVLDRTPLMESVDEVDAFYDADHEEITRLLLEHRAVSIDGMPRGERLCTTRFEQEAKR